MAYWIDCNYPGIVYQGSEADADFLNRTEGCAMWEIESDRAFRLHFEGDEGFPDGWEFEVLAAQPGVKDRR